MQKSLTIFSLFFISLFSAYADELSEGYASFAKNDLKAAYQHFEAASLVQSTKAESFLMLSMMAPIDKDDKTAFNYFLEFYKSTPNPMPYIMALFRDQNVLGYSSIKTKEQLAWMEELLTRTDLDPTIKGNLYEVFGKYYESTNKLAKSREYFAKVGAIMDWQIVGDFENISASGFDKNYDPISNPKDDVIFKNKINADVKWFNLTNQVNGKWIDLTNNFNCTNTLVFAQTFCTSSQDRNVYLRVGTSGSLKIWVNDQLIFKEEEERNNGMDTYVVPASLSKGNNRILLQVASSKISECNFMVRATTSAGDLISDLKFSPTYLPYSKSVQTVAPIKRSLADEFFSAQIKEHPAKLVNYLILANEFLSNDKTYDAQKVLLEAQKLAPNCSYVLEQLAELYIRDKNRTSTSVVQEQIKSIDPNCPSSIDYIISNAFEAENYKEARLNIDKYEKLYGENKNLFLYKIKLASAENKAEEYLELTKRACEKFPAEYIFMYDRYQYEKGYKKDQKAGIKILKDYTSKYMNLNALSFLSDEYFESGQIEDGISVLKKLIEYCPFSDGYYRQLGLVYLQIGRNNEARENLEKCLQIAPYYGPYHGNYGKVFEATNQIDKAISEYKLDIIYRPDDYKTIEKLRTLQNEKDVFDYFPAQDYYKLFDESPVAADYPSDSFISLCENKQVVLYENGGCESRYTVLLKALTLKGIDYLKEYNVGYSSNEELTIEKAEVLKKNGNRLQAEVKDNHIVYTSLEPGDATLLIYKKSKSVTSQMSKNFYEKAYLNNWYPSLNIEYNLLCAKSIKFNHVVSNSTISPIVKDLGEYSLFSWKKTNNKSLHLESYMPPLVDVCEVLSISTISDWDYISKWYYDISNTKTKPTREVTETVNSLLEGKGSLSQLEKANIIYNYIEKTIRYSSVSFRQNGIVPQRASEVLVTRMGDCKDFSVLFNSMCQVAGIKAKIVLVIRHQNGSNWIALPSFDFDHAIAKATLDGKDYYIELTSSYYPFGALGDSHISAVTLDVDDDKQVKIAPQYLNPSTRLPNNVSRNSKVSFTGDNMTTTTTTMRTGSVASDSRESYKDLGKEERETKFTKSITDEYSNIKLLNLEFNKNLSDCSDTVSYSYSVKAPKVFTKINDLYIVKLPMTEKISPMDFLSLEERKYPIEMWKYSSCDTVSERVEINFPEGKSLVETPKSVHYSCNQADYNLVFELKNRMLIVTRTFVIKGISIPSTDYMDYRKFIDLVATSDAQQLGFK